MKNKSIYLILILIIVSTVVVIMATYSTYSYMNTKDEIVKDLKSTSKKTLEKLNLNIKNFILSYSVNQYNNLVYNEMQTPYVMAIIVNDYNMAQITASTSYYIGKIKDNDLIVDYNPQNTRHTELINSSYYTSELDIVDSYGNTVGKITMYNSDKELKKELDNIIRDSIVSTFVVSFLLIVFLFILIKFFLLNHIESIIEGISKRDEEGIPLDLVNTDLPKEIASLSLSINNMIVSIKESNNNLKERLYLAWNGVNDSIWDWDIKTDDVYYSENWENILGYKKSELGNNSSSFFNLIHPSDMVLVRQMLENHFKDPEKNIYSLEIRMKGKDGLYKWVLTRGKVSLNENNEPIRMLGFGTDITNKKDIEEKLKEKKEEFETIFNYSKDGLAILDLDMNFLKFNDAYLELSGFDEQELISKPCINLENKTSIVDEIIQRGYINNLEIQYNKSILNLSLSLLPDKKRIIVNAKDITNRKIIENQSKLASMGEMIGNIAHQWRQPLNLISTTISGMKVKHELGMKIEEKELILGFDNVVKQTEYLSNTIDDFRSFIKIDEVEDNILISSIVDKTLSILNSVIVDNHIKVIVNKQVDKHILCYENELIQALLNILNNAKDALLNQEEKFIFIDIKEDEDNLHLSIKDNANGIKEDILDKVFEPYFTTKHQSVGTGLGLAMAYKILTQRHDGEIKVQNEEYTYNKKNYRGACFTLVFKDTQ